MRPFSRLALALSAVALLALLIPPQTCWLVGTQIGSTFRLIHPFGWAVQIYWPQPDGSSYTGLLSLDTERERAALNSRPGDLPMQIAYARTLSQGADREDVPLRALLPRFPNSPSLYANLLRCEAYQMSVFLRRRPEIELLDGVKPARRLGGGGGRPGGPPGDTGRDNRPPAPWKPTVQDLAQLQIYDQDAVMGEKLDPANAYFPLLRAAGLYAAHRDVEALAAIRQASTKPLWKEYGSEEAAGAWRLHEAAFGDRTGVNRAAATASVQMPQYFLVAYTARIATYQAMQTEEAGDAEKGIAIRQELMRCGSRMRAQSWALVGTDTGMAVAGTSRWRPGGAAALVDSDNFHLQESGQKRLDAYCAYLRSHGHVQEEREVRAESAARRAVQHVFGEDDPIQADADDAWNAIYEQGPYGRSMRRLTFWWLADLSLLSNALWTLILGGAAALLSRLRRLREGRSQPYPLGRGVLLLLAVTAAITPLVFLAVWLVEWVSASWQNGWSDILLLLDGAALLGVMAATVWLVGFRRQEAANQVRKVVAWVRKAGAWTKPMRTKEVFRAAGFWLTVLFSVATVGFAAYWQSSGLRDAVSVVEIFPWSDALTRPEEALVFHTLYGFLAAPLLILLVLALTTLVRRVPFAVGLVRGFRDAALPLAAFLVLAYGVTAWQTSRQERVVSRELARMQQQGEGPYYAALTGQVWPGPTH